MVFQNKYLGEKTGKMFANYLSLSSHLNTSIKVIHERGTLQTYCKLE
jgi:hypothetical protein